ncbi:uncharacterized protein M8220_015433 [Acridotheres tristis]
MWGHLRGDPSVCLQWIRGSGGFGTLATPGWSRPIWQRSRGRRWQLSSPKRITFLLGTLLRVIDRWGSSSRRMPPWKYLGLQITNRTIVPQKLAINNNPKTLADLHQLCGSLNWARPWLGLTTKDLAPVFNLLEGREELSSSRVLTPEMASLFEPRMILHLIVILCVSQSSEEWIIPQPHRNVWVTLVQAMKQGHMCLSMAAADDPMSTCLMGIPFKPKEFPKQLITIQENISARKVPKTFNFPVVNPPRLWREWIKVLPKAKEEPQEFEILGSSPAFYCVYFACVPPYYPKVYTSVTQYQLEYQAARWCNNTSHVRAAFTNDPCNWRKMFF